MVHCIAEDKKLIFKFEGRLDTTNCLTLKKEIWEKVGGFDGCVVFDLERVDYVASSFLRLCLETCKEVGAGQFLLDRVAPEIKKVFKIAGFDIEMSIQ